MFNLTNIVRPNIVALQPYSSARDEFEGSEGIFLDANENPFGILNRYPDPLQKQLKQRLGEIKGIDSQNTFIGNGSDEAIDLCLRIFCEPGKDKVLTFSPTYGMYQVAADINNVELITLPLNGNFQVDFEQSLPLLQDETLKIIFICSPNNPTGNTVDGIETLLQNFSGVVVVDEAYADFNDASLLGRLAQYPNLIILQTLSKAWGLAAARVGMAFASTEIIKLFNKVKPPYNISSLNYTAAIQALADTQGFESRKALLISEREKLALALAELPLVTTVYPSDANFILIAVTDADAVYNTLAQEGIIIRNRSKVVPGGLRISIGTPAENATLVTALKNLSA
ncbi:histidinol phosphate aminotransferase [Flavobacterium akiainvivens]|uniref:Histidinol-phosphate aminotransferase n=1 Tax=Flavobacterium akiainvivens TaxID=1202724 RepID=A0A0M9VHL8_9FLAO|nr:histidinol-phosphate transaminase [Flavobacterium akiainvivens]KOS05702.1 histidinol phosphate aminotransferase [Flavobacterium akiainvivens]SFQ36943.1 histidinol-phosphate aminotransferase [Flavobacterium akiainvivens]